MIFLVVSPMAILVKDLLITPNAIVPGCGFLHSAFDSEFLFNTSTMLSTMASEWYEMDFVHSYQFLFKSVTVSLWFSSSQKGPPPSRAFLLPISRII